MNTTTQGISSLQQRLIEKVQMRQLAPKTRERFSPLTLLPFANDHS